ncbi:immunoglobulin I-set domain protein [Cooperia oncophora]
MKLLPRFLVLKEGQKRVPIRVKSCNKAGSLERRSYSKAEKVIAKPRNLKRGLGTRKMKTMTIKVGHDIVFDVPVRGEPPPQKTWMFADKPIDESKVKIENEDYKTNLVLRNATRANAGKYTLTAKNASGMDTHSVDVIVLGRPSAPEGPLEVSNVFEEIADLAWSTATTLDCRIDHYRYRKA